MRAVCMKNPQYLLCEVHFGAKHHEAVQYMARWIECPLPPPMYPPPLNPPPPGPPQEDKEDKEESATLPARDFALQLP